MAMSAVLALWQSSLATTNRVMIPKDGHCTDPLSAQVNSSGSEGQPLGALNLFNRNVYPIL